MVGSDAVTPTLQFNIDEFTGIHPIALFKVLIQYLKEIIGVPEMYLNMRYAVGEKPINIACAGAIVGSRMLQ
jgi:hypothetical protein